MYGLLKAATRDGSRRIDHFFEVELPVGSTGADVEREGKAIAEQRGWQCIVVVPLSERAARLHVQRHVGQDTDVTDIPTLAKIEPEA